MTLEQAKAIWKNRDGEVRDLIIQSLQDESVFNVPYSQRAYFVLWKQLIKERLGIDCNPIEYMRSFSYKTFSDYWRAINGH